ncbi:MAG: imidazole glycerol phosphate synthase subunit HisH [Patescibacteria group bacterium]|jgi:glutamine amidotransferase
MKVAIVDYKLSNLFSVQHACEYVGMTAEITSSPEKVLNADGVILPGVGAFADAMKNLENFGLLEAIKTFIKSGKPFMGICLGLQLLFSESEEFGTHRGLDIIPGKVIKFPLKNHQAQITKIPQIGWNSINKPHSSPDIWDHTPLTEIKEGELMYFVHSYYVLPEHNKHILTLTTYDGTTYASGILRENVVAFQFHPEKSGPDGVSIYRHWAKNI